MKIVCPSCGAPVAGSDINIQTGSAVCRTCNEVFAIGNPGIAVQEPVSVDKPSGTAIEYVTYGDGFGLIFPRRNLIGLGVFLVVFGGIWDSVSGSMLAMELFGKKAHVISSMMIMVIPAVFFITGLAILLGGIAILLMRTAIIAKDRTIRIVRTIHRKEFVTEIPVADIRNVEQVERYSQNQTPVYGLGITRGNGSICKVGAKLSPEEINWLRSLILGYRGNVPDPGSPDHTAVDGLTK